MKLVFLFASLVGSVVLAQDAPPPAASQSNPMAAAATQAFASFDAAATWGCEVVIEEPAAGEGTGAMFVVGGGSGGDDAKDFQGSAEFIVTEDGEKMLISREKLPGFACYDNGDRRIVESLREETGVNPKTAINDLFGLLDSADLAKHLDKSKFTESLDETAGTRTLVGTLPKRMLRSSDASSPMAMFSPKVLTIVAKLTLDAQGAVTAAEFRVQRTDPQAGIRRQIQEGGAESGMMVGGMPEASDDPGATHVYTLTRKKAPPTERAMRFHAAMREIVDEV